MIRFGFHPIANELDSLPAEVGFDRAVVFDEPVSALFDRVGEVRTTSGAPGLPAGLYWFDGVEDPIVMQIGSGPRGTSSRLELATWDDAVEHPLADAYGWAEHLWAEGNAVPAPKFSVGARAMRLPGGDDVEVRDRTFDSEWSYKVRGDTGLVSVLESRLEGIETSDDPTQWVVGEASSAARFGATLTRTKLRGRFADTVYSFRATRTVFRPYQFKPVLKLLQTGQARILIADEVGLGKTIEAGLIWTELEARHEADRVLIVCPSALVDKWRDEMQERFNYDLLHLTTGELARFLEQHREGRVPRRKAYVVSLETLRTWKALEELADNPPEFDLVIVDEAHSMRNTETKSYQLGTQLSEWTVGSNMVFLTATSINLRETDLLHLLGLLEPADFDTIDDLEARLAPNAVLNAVGKMLTDQTTRYADFELALSELRGMVFERAITVRPEFRELHEILERAPLAPKDIAAARRLVGELNALSTTVTRTRRAEVDEKKAVRDAEPGIEVVWRREESAFYAEYIEWCKARADLANTPMYFSMQMPIRLASTSIHSAARDVLRRGGAEFWAGDGADAPTNWIQPHPELIAAARRVLEVPDSKLEKLDGVLAELHQLGRQALLFTWSKETLKHLQSTFADQYRIAVLNGDVRRDARRQVMKDFRDGKYDFVFANRVASEGLDFEFCSAVINYDLPWNPMEIEQRIGRIDRIGQRSEKILIRNFYNNEAIDSRILFKVLQRIDIFERSIGDLEPIIGQHMDVLRSAMDFRLSPQQQAEKAQQFLTAIEAQRAGLREVAESAAGLIISNDVDVAGLQEELVATGRYLGQMELAHLLDDWSQTDGGGRVSFGSDNKSIEVTGNSAMAQRVIDLATSGRRTGSETATLATDLKNGSTVHLSLDQELSRTSGLDLLAAMHPLVMAAADVPGHRQARFATLQIPGSPDVNPGTYVVVLAHAEQASRGGDEIWGAAVDMDGVSCGEAPADALLAALAKGLLADGAPGGIPDLPRLAGRAQREIELRHRKAQGRRDVEEGALTEARHTILTEQHQRRMVGIERRMKTLLERDRGQKVLHMVEGQRRRQVERYERLLAELETKATPTVAVRYLAACVLEVTE